MRYFCRHILLFAALGVLLCSCGGKRVDGDIGDASEPLYLRISERPQGGWIAVSVSPFDGSSDTLVIDRPMTNIIVMSTSHYGFLDALGCTDIISGISGPDFLWTASPSRLVSVALASDLAAGLASPDRGRPRHARGGTGAKRSGVSGGASRSEAVEPQEVPSAQSLPPNRPQRSSRQSTSGTTAHRTMRRSWRWGRRWC